VYAVIESGGRQFRVTVGDVVHLPRLADPVGGEVVLDRVLMVGEGTEARIGAPTLDGACVRGKVVAQDLDRKVLTYIHKRRKNAARKSRGHRQPFTAVKVEAIEA
jgi:large subunit ribosomal protein L21